MLNLTRLHLGIAHESQFQGLGINGLGVAGWTCCSHSLFDPTLDTGRHQPAIGLDFAPAKRSAARSAPHHRNNELGQGRSRAADVTVTQVRRILSGKLILVLQAGQPILGIGRHSRVGPPH